MNTTSRNDKESWNTLNSEESQLLESYSTNSEILPESKTQGLNDPKSARENNILELGSNQNNENNQTSK